MEDVASKLGEAILRNLKIDGTPEKLMGARVTFSKTLMRERKYLNKDIFVWVEKNHLTLQNGIIVGARYLQNGEIEFYRKEPPTWVFSHLTPCILAAISPFRKPVHVPLNGIVSIELR